MKTNFKRLFALVLTLCMLASLMVPVAFAEDAAVAAPSAAAAETYPIRLKDVNHTDPLTATGLDALMVNTNASGVTSYKAPTLTDKKLVNAYADGTLNWKFVATSNEAVYRSDRAWQLRLNKGWAAFQIRVEDTGLYALNLASDKNAYETWENDVSNWVGDISAYIIPVADFSVDAIDSLLTDEYSVGTAAMAADQSNVTFAKSRMKAGEYVVVINNPIAVGLSIAELSLLGEAYEMENVDTFNLRPFDMANYDITTYEGTNNALMLENGAFAARVLSSTVISGTGVNYSYYNAVGSSYLRASGAWQMDAKDGAIGLVINVPESGDMYFSLTTDKTNYTETATPWANSFTTFEANHKLWLIPYDVALETAGGTTSALRKAALTTLTADDTYCIGTEYMYSFQETITFDTTYIEAGQYVVAFEALDKQGAWCELSLDKVAGQELPESDKVTGEVASYNFELYDTEEYANFFMGISRNLSNSAKGSQEGYYAEGDLLQDVLDRNFANGQLNWTVKAINNVGVAIRGDKKDGLRIQKPAADVANSGWAAISVNVPVGGIYGANIVSEYASNNNTNIYVLPADADIASSLTEDNKVGMISKEEGLNFRATFTAGENLIVFELQENAKERTVYLSNITLSVQENESVTYNFDLFNSEVYLNALTEKSGGQITALDTASSANLNKYEWTGADGAAASISGAELIAELFVAGKMNWALDSMKVDNALKSVNHPSGSLQFRARNCDDGYTSLRIRVENAGTYNITVNASCTTNPYNAYLFPATKNYTTYKSSCIDAVPYMTEDYFLGTSETKGAAVTATYTFKQPGEYVLVIAETGTGNNDIFVASMVMEPAEVNYVADGNGYETLNDALANATESVILLQNAEVGNLVINPGVTLDLNGYILYASSVDATAPGAQIIDATDGKGLIRGEIEFAEGNAQLPLYDIDANGYKLFNVDVVSSATTGSGSSTKYWFKVSFTNSAAFELIGANTELRFMADMSGFVKGTDEPFTAEAIADAIFTNKWAANNTSYIVVSANSEASGINPFQLTPAVTANGVVISGTAMGKG